MASTAKTAAGLWAIRHAEVERCLAAEQSFNAEHDAINQDDDDLRERLAATYGSLEAARANPVGAKLWEASYAKIQREDARQGVLISATDSAIEALMLTEPPGWTELVTAIRLVEERELWANSNLALHPVTAIRQAIEALAP